MLKLDSRRFSRLRFLPDLPTRSTEIHWGSPHNVPPGSTVSTVSLLASLTRWMSPFFWGGIWYNIYIYAHVHVCAYVYVYVYVDVDVDVYVNAYVNVYVYAYVYMYMYICIYVYVYMYVSMYVYMYVSMYVYIIYIYTYRFPRDFLHGWTRRNCEHLEWMIWEIYRALKFTDDKGCSTAATSWHSATSHNTLVEAWVAWVGGWINTYKHGQSVVVRKKCLLIVDYGYLPFMTKN